MAQTYLVYNKGVLTINKNVRKSQELGFCLITTSINNFTEPTPYDSLSAHYFLLLRPTDHG